MQVSSIISPADSRRILRRPRTMPGSLRAGIVVALGLLLVAALPLMSDLTWPELAQEASDQALAALQLVQAAFTILTL